MTIVAWSKVAELAFRTLHPPWWLFSTQPSEQVGTQSVKYCQQTLHIDQLPPRDDVAFDDLPREISRSEALLSISYWSNFLSVLLYHEECDHMLGLLGLQCNFCSYQAFSVWRNRSSPAPCVPEAVLMSKLGSSTRFIDLLS